MTPTRIEVQKKEKNYIISFSLPLKQRIKNLFQRETKIALHQSQLEILKQATKK